MKDNPTCAESAKYISPMATPWGRECRRAICVPKGQHIFGSQYFALSGRRFTWNISLPKALPLGYDRYGFQPCGRFLAALRNDRDALAIYEGGKCGGTNTKNLVRASRRRFSAPLSIAQKHGHSDRREETQTMNNEPLTI